MTKIIEYGNGDRFIFVLDEWDYIYHQTFVTEKDKESFTRFLSVHLKDQPYVEMAYMTGILPIAKYSSGSGLNMFCEYTMVNEEKYDEYFGFTDREVDELFIRYQAKNPAGCFWLQRPVIQKQWQRFSSLSIVRRAH